MKTLFSRHRSTLAMHVMLCLSYFVLAKSSLLLATSYSNITPIWPAAGVSVAALYLYGYKYAPALFVGALLAFLSQGMGIPISIGMGIGTISKGLLVAYLLHRVFYRENLFGDIRNIMLFCAISIIGSIVASTIGTLSLYWGGAITVLQFATSFYIQLCADVLGIILISPFLITLHTNLPTKSQGKLLEGICAFGGLLLSTIVAFGVYNAHRYMIFLFLIWIATRFTLRLVTFGTLAIALIGFSFSLQNMSLFPGSAVQDRLIFLQMFFAVAQITALALAAMTHRWQSNEIALRHSRDFLDLEVKRRTEKLAESEERFRHLAEALPHIVYMSNTKGEVEYYNQRWFEYTGLDTEMNSWGDLIHPLDKPDMMKAWETSRKTGKVYEAEFRMRQRDGAYRWHVGKAIPIHNAEGKIEKWIGTSTDIDDRKQIENNLRFLSEASKELSQSLDYRATLERVSQIAVPYIADWCTVHLLKDERSVEQVGLAHVNPEKIAWARSLNEREEYNPDAPTGIAKVMRSCQAELYPLITDETIALSAKNQEHLDILRQIQMISVMIVPIIDKGKALGAISFISTSESGRQFNKNDLRMAEELASRVSLAIVNAKLYNESQREIEARKRTEEELRVIQRQFQGLYDANIVGVIYADLKGNIKKANDAFLEMIGYTQNDLKSGQVNWSDMTPEEWTEADERAISNLMEEGMARPYEKEYFTKDGDRVPVIVAAALINKKTTETIALILDISQRKELEERKDEFIGIASHELKTPLTSIKGYIQILERIIQQMGDEKLKIYLDRTNIYIEKLNSLITDLLDVSKIQAGKLQMNFENFNFHEVVEDAVESVEYINSTHQIIIDGSSNIIVTGDRHRLEQVIVNLLSNAIKYSPLAEKVEVTIRQQAGEMVFSVRDYGVGIPEQEHEKLFQRFYRSEHVSRDISGLGIGLYISHEIVTRHQGRMWIESEEGKGATFYFALPLPSGRALVV